jgi:hypothetical protein
MEADEQEGDFQDFAASAAGAQPNFGRQDRMRQAAELKAARSGETALKSLLASPIEGVTEETRGSLTKALRKQKASWQTDGLGIRGHATVVSNASANLLWGSSGVTRRANPELDAGSTEVAAEVPTGE